MARKIGEPKSVEERAREARLAAYRLKGAVSNLSVDDWTTELAWELDRFLYAADRVADYTVELRKLPGKD